MSYAFPLPAMRRELPILMSAPMVLAARRRLHPKRETRRAIKHFDGSCYARAPDYVGHWKEVDGKWWAYPRGSGASALPCHGVRCRYGQPGDRLWVRETFAVMEGGSTPGGRPHDPFIIYRADGATSVKKWTPGIHMPRRIARLFLDVDHVRIERLQMITPRAVLDEGLTSGRVSDYADLWDSLNPRGRQWQDNPWVFVIGFSAVSAA